MPKKTRSSKPDIESVLKEKRIFKPASDFARRAHMRSFAEHKKISKAAARNPQAYWGKAARELDWFTPWKKVLDWKPPFAKWFVGGKINVAYNCLDRHLSTWRRNKAALLWEGEPGDRRTITYQELHREVCKFANVLKASGVGKGDRVAIYMPMIPELPIAMLACARIGAIHNVVFGGFSAESLRDRINDAEAKLLVTADGGWRRGSVVALKSMADDALKGTPTVERAIVVRRIGEPCPMEEGRDFWWHDLMENAPDNCPPAKLDSEHPLYILYTSGSTGKPKGVLHTTGGYLTHVTHPARLIFDLKEEDTFWCTADIGWVTGHSYIVYGILANGTTSVMYEGAPNFPANDRFWDIVERHRVTVFYTAPTAIRTFMRWGEKWPNKRDLSSLRLLGTVGEPINPEAWMWYHRVIGKKRCPIVDTWWQTETGGILITPLPGAVPTKPGSCTLPFPGIDAEVVSKDGKPVPPNTGGFLVLRKPWPGMLRTIYGDRQRYKEQYWREIPGVYFAGDGARRDEDGYFWVMGRIDDVMNVAGHRLSTMEIESALVSHVAVTEAAVVGKPDDMKGTAVSAFVTLEGGRFPDHKLKDQLRDHVAREIGPIAKPDEIRFTDALPKTRSGKIMRRLLRDIASGKASVGDTTTLEDYSVLAKLREEEEA
jgi:acetyl-CoA synthetase